MPRVYLNAKTTVEDCVALSIFQFYRTGTLKTSHSGTITWSNYSDSKSSIAYTVNVERFTSDWDYAKPYLNLSYSVNDSQKQQRDINQTFYLSKTLCEFGGYRYWFICKCGKQVGVLYKPNFSDKFACRCCYKLTYESRNRSGFEKRMGKVPSIPELDALRESAKRIFYKGKLTGKYIKYQRKLDQFKSYHENWLGNFKKRFIKSK